MSDMQLKLYQKNDWVLVGSHECQCATCKGRFIGQKRDVTCPFCLTKALQSSLTASEERVREQYIPGILKCKKCEFVLHSNAINASTGEMRASNKSEDCPNCNVPLWRITYKDEYNEAIALHDKMFDEKEKAEQELARVRKTLEEIREIYAGMEEFKAVTAPEAYLQRIIKQMWEVTREELSHER